MSYVVNKAVGLRDIKFPCVNQVRYHISVPLVEQSGIEFK
jgi:hypothetical protein